MLTSFGPFVDGYHDARCQVQDWVMAQARRHFEEDRARRRGVVDAASFEAYQQQRRERFLQSIGGLPQERTPLEVQETGRLRRDGYTIRKLIYQSLPGMYVTALLYVPEGGTKPGAGFPAVFMACGHHKDGKASPHYQKVCIDLARSGFVVLIIDSPSQGEMVQCLEAETGEPLVGLNTIEHSYLQLSASVLNGNISRYFLWNAIRGIDLLVGLPEVDPDRLGATGNSGGGTLTQYLMMVEPRIRAAMPCCSLSSRESYLATGSRAYDGEQNLFRAIPDGVDYADFLVAFAPRPLRVGAAAYDFFAIEAVVETVAEARGVYGALDAAAALDLCVAKGENHGYTTPLRRGSVAFFLRHLQEREAAPFTDEPATEPHRTLQCTRSGQVMLEYADARSILDLLREGWRQRRGIGSDGELRRVLQEMVGPVSDQPLWARRTVQVQTDQGLAERVFFLAEPGVITTAVVYRPAGTIERAALLLIPEGTAGQEAFADEIRQRVEAGQMVMVFDVRGTGAVKMLQRNHGEGLAFRSTEFRVASDHFLLGTSLATRRAHDVLQALRYLREREEIGPETPVELAAFGWPAVYGLIAAAVDEGLAACSFEGLPASWGEAFELNPPDPERISEALILPELAGRADIDDLLRLAGATPGREAISPLRASGRG